MKDLVVLVADKDMEYSLAGLLSRPLALGIRPISHDVFVHPDHDPGCALRGVTFLSNFAAQYRHGLILFDHEGSGRESAPARNLQESVNEDLAHSCSQSLHELRDAAVLSLGFAAALRRSELCRLRTDDLERRGSEGMLVHVRRSKTDVVGVGQSIAVIEGKLVRPIERVDRWLCQAGINKGFVFQTLQRGGVASGRPLDPGDVARIVKRHARRIGLEPQEYSGHSLRAGFVTSAAVHRARIDKIMEVTRHRNAETVLKYIRDEQSFVDHAGSSFL